MLRFSYTEDLTGYEELLSTPLTKCRCKHVMSIKSDRARRVHEESSKINYGAIWGYKMGIHKDESKNKEIQLQTIRRMIYKGYRAPFRVVIDKEGDAWIDNLHSALRDFFILGDVTLMETGCYFVDTRHEPLLIVSKNGSVKKNIEDIGNVIKIANIRLSRVSQGLKDVHYTIGDFMEDNGICHEKIFTWE